MKKVVFILAIFLIGCQPSPTQEIIYTRNDEEVSLKIIHRGGGSVCTITLKDAESARKYKERLQRLVREIEDFEKELSIREKK